MTAFVPIVALPRSATLINARPRTQLPRFTASLRPGSRLRVSLPTPVPADERDIALSPAVAVSAPVDAFSNVHNSSAKTKENPQPISSALRSLVKAVIAVAAAIKRARSRHVRALRFARVAMGAVMAAAAVVALRGGGGAIAGAASVPANSAATGAGVALPAELSGLASMLPEGVVSALRPFTESFGVVFVSEFGDKSMFATALMAMKHSPWLVLIGALAALTVMTLIACFLGQLMHLLPATVTHYSTIALFVFFGAQMLLQARSLPSTPGAAAGERADAEQMVAGSTLAATAVRQSPITTLAKISSLIFVAEWCDRSMIATMALAASSNTLAVVGGATAANVVCTGFAVGAAAFVASRISERTVAIIAGVLFEFFAVFTFLEGPEA